MAVVLYLYEDKRIHSAGKILPNGNYDGMPVVEVLPEGNITDYLYVNGEYIYNPLPKPSVFPIAPRNVVEGEYITVNGTLYKAIANIPNGEYIIVGKNVTETTIEAQLLELKGE